MTNLQYPFAFFCLLCVFWLSACQQGTTPNRTLPAETAYHNRLSPDRVDIRRNILRSRYNQGQVMLEVEGTPSQYSRFTRAYVLVLPNTQIVGSEGSSISLSELRQGQQVAVLLRSGGNGNLEGIGIARKMWVEDVF